MRRNFSEKVIQIVKEIQSGKTLTYKEVAKLAGNERAARAVGNILNRYYHSCEKDGLLKKNGLPLIPCHRVVRSDGKSGGFVLGEKKKREMLEKEKRVK